MILVLIRCLSYELTAKTGTKQRKENSEKVSEIKQFKGYTRCRVLFTGEWRDFQRWGGEAGDF